MLILHRDDDYRLMFNPSGLAKSVLLIMLMAALITVLPAHALDVAAVPVSKQNKTGLYLDAREAYELKQRLADKVLFIDIRTRAEISSLGMPTLVDAHIPFLEYLENPAWDDKNLRFKMEFNPGFSAEMQRRMHERGLSKDDTVILICRSGDRSARATDYLLEDGYKKIYTVIDGFEGDMQKDGPNAGRRMVNGWKNANLPWSYQLDKNKMYLQKR